METETIDKLFLELSQFTRATTSREIALERELEFYQKEYSKYHDVMDCLRGMDMPHGLCEPRERKACTHCNSVEKLAELRSQYKGRRIRLT